MHQYNQAIALRVTAKYEFDILKHGATRSSTLHHAPSVMQAVLARSETYVYAFKFDN